MIPLIPIIMAVASVAGGLAQGISSIKNTQNQMDTTNELAQQKINERAKQAKKLMSQQKTSFLKGGVYFAGTPEEVINETYNTSQDDINALIKDSETTKGNLKRQGTTAFYSSLMEGIGNAALSYIGLGGAGTGKIGSALKETGSSIANSKAGTAIQQLYNSKRGWNVGSFDSISNVGQKIV